MSRSSFSIRRLRSLRQDTAFDDITEFDSDDSSHYNKPERKPRRTTWFTSRNKKETLAPITISRPLSSGYAVDPAHPFSVESPGSSVSSLCSCERHGDYGSIGSNRYALCSGSLKDDGSTSSTPLTSITSYDASNSSLPRLVDSSVSSRQRVGPIKSKIDLIEALSLEPENKDSLRTSPSSNRRQPPRGYRGSIEQLLLDTDEAIREVGDVMDIYLSPSCYQDSADCLPIIPHTPPEQSPSTLQSQYSPPFRTPPPPPPPPPPRANSSPEANPNHYKRTRQPKSPRKPPMMKSNFINNTRWSGISNDILTGKIFTKLEADEVLSPRQIEAYKIRRNTRIAAQTSTSADMLRPADADTADITPVDDSFHMEDLPRRIGSSGIQFAVSSVLTSVQSPDLTGPSDTISHDNSPLHAQEGLCISNVSSDFPSPDPADASSKRLSIPPTPPLKSARYLLNKKQLPALPTISESGSGAPRQPEIFAMEDHEPQPTQSDNTVDRNYVYLGATPFSVTMPSFRHGPIRLAKSDVCPDPKLGADEGLDWTAFQMAILCGAGDWDEDNEDASKWQELEDADLLGNWWDGLGFKGAGGLVTEETDVLSPTSTISGSTIPEPNDLTPGLLTPARVSRSRTPSKRYSMQIPARFSPLPDLHQQVPELSTSLSSSVESSGGIREITAPSINLSISPARTPTVPPKKSRVGSLGLAPVTERCELPGTDSWLKPTDPVGNEDSLMGRESLMSMPQSPMMDLRIIESDNGDIDYVPMSYNLSHDLGDFLRWEAENVYSDNGFCAGSI